MADLFDRPATARELAEAVELNRELTTRLIGMIAAGIGSDSERQKAANDAFDNTNDRMDSLLNRLKGS